MLSTRMQVKKLYEAPQQLKNIFYINVFIKQEISHY